MASPGWADWIGSVSRRRVAVAGGIDDALLHEHELTEPRWHVRPRGRVLWVRPDAHPPVRLGAVPPVDVGLPYRADAGRTARQFFEVRPGDGHFEAPSVVGIFRVVQRASERRHDRDAGCVEALEEGAAVVIQIV